MGGGGKLTMYTYGDKVNARKMDMKSLTDIS